MAWIGLVAGLVLAAGPVVLWISARGEPLGPLAPAPQVASAPLRDPIPARPRVASLGAPGVAAGAAAAAAAAVPPAPPVRVRAAHARLDAAVVDTGVDDHGGMAIPQDIHTVGWYRFGVGPGTAAGSAVLAGHVDDKIQGEGAFSRIGRLVVGDPVQVTLADGRVLTYRVSSVEHVVKAALPAGRVFARDGPPRLTLVTCGGAFDPAVGGYVDNVLVTATPDPRS